MVTVVQARLTSFAKHRAFLEEWQHACDQEDETYIPELRPSSVQVLAGR